MISKFSLVIPQGVSRNPIRARERTRRLTGRILNALLGQLTLLVGVKNGVLFAALVSKASLVAVLEPGASLRFVASLFAPRKDNHNCSTDGLGSTIPRSFRKVSPPYPSHDLPSLPSPCRAQISRSIRTSSQVTKISWVVTASHAMAPLTANHGMSSSPVARSGMKVYPCSSISSPSQPRAMFVHVLKKRIRVHNMPLVPDLEIHFVYMKHGGPLSV